MRRIVTQQDREQRRKRSNLIIGILLLVLMVLSSAGYAFMSFQDNSGDVQSGSSDKQQLADGRWKIKVGSQYLIFTHSPSAVASIPVEAVPPISYYASAPVYLVSNGETINYEIGSTLGGYTTLHPACLGPCEKDIPEKNCTELLIVFNKSEENKVYQQDNCIFIQGDLRAVDAFLYRIFGIT